jgi:hypothetical protein
MSERRDIHLITAAGDEKLPLILLRSWRQWKIDSAGLQEIPTAGNTGDWLQFMLKAGEVRCIMPSLSTQLEVGDQRFCNRGLRTLPLAHTWTSFAGLQLGNLRLHAFHRGHGEEAWHTWAAPQGIEAALSGLVRVLAEGPEPLRQGFHLLSVALSTPELELQTDHEYGLVLAAGTCFEDVLDRPQAPCACLKVKTCRTARLSESFRCPEVYQDLIRSEQANG